MKPLTPHDPFDDLIAAALHNDLTPEERTQFESRLQTDPAAQAAYKEAQAMHDLLEKTHKEAQPDPAFEQRMVSGVRRKIQTGQHRETAWESALLFWKWFGRLFRFRWNASHYAVICAISIVVTGLSYCVYHDIGQLRVSSTDGISNPSASGPRIYLPSSLYASVLHPDVEGFVRKQRQVAAELAAQKAAMDSALAAAQSQKAPVLKATDDITTVQTTTTPPPPEVEESMPAHAFAFANRKAMPDLAPTAAPTFSVPLPQQAQADAPSITTTVMNLEMAQAAKNKFAENEVLQQDLKQQAAIEKSDDAEKKAALDSRIVNSDAEPVAPAPAAPEATTDSSAGSLDSLAPPKPAPASTPAPPAIDSRKLIRNAQLDLEVKSFQTAMDQITALTKAAGGYVDTSNSQKGGNGKLQGTVVVKVLPQNLDDFLIKLRDLGEVQNQSVSTDDVTKDYFDTQARLANSQRMETQLQDLLKRENGKVSDLLAVERELGRVRGEIEQDQGQIKLYDFQVQFATVTMNMREKDLNQSAAYLLKEQDDFSLYSTNVEDSFQKARAAADGLKAQVLAANLNHNSGTDVSAELMVMVAPDQVESFLDQIRALGRVTNFTRQTQRVPKDGGDPNQPADETATEKDKVQVHVVIRYENTTAAYLLKEQDDFSLFATDVETAFQSARKAADDFKAQVLAANLNHNSGSDVSAELMVLVAPDQIEPFLDQIRSLGRIANFTRQTQRVAQAGSTGDQPADQTLVEKDKVQVHLVIRSDDETREQVALTVVAKAVDSALDQAKAAALANAGTEILSSSLNKSPQGASTAQLSVRVPGKEYTALLAAFNALGRTASLGVQRNDNSGPGANGDDAPVIISLSLTDDDTPLQETELTVGAADVDGQSQQIKKAAGDAGVEVKASSYERQPDGTELAQMTFRLPMSKYSAFIETVKALGKVESLTIHRDDHPDQTRADDTSPAEISLTLHNQRDIIADDNGLWATLRQTFGEGAGALFGSIRVIGVIVAFLIPWIVTLLLLAWAGRRIYIWRKK